MQLEKKYFPHPQAGLDADSAPFAVGQHDWVNAENVRTLSTDSGVVGTVEAIGSTKQLSAAEPSVSFCYLGGAEDQENSRLLYFLCDLHSNKHKIMCYDYNQDTIYTVLLATQVTGGLNFDKDHFIHSARVIDGLLYFTDNLNEPRRLNIDAGIKLNQPTYNTSVAAYSAPLNPEVITIIRRPPNYCLTFEKKKASDLGIQVTTNQIAENAFRFTYFFTFRDNEQSTLAAHSIICPYNYYGDLYDLVQLKVPSTQLIDQDVQRITLVCIYAAPDENTAFEIKTWDKSNSSDATDIANHNAGTSQLTYNFTNNDVGNPIAVATLYKLFDSVPLLSKTLENADNRLFLGNNLMGYSAPLKTSLNAAVAQQSFNPAISGRTTATINGTWSTIWVNVYNSPTDPRGYEDYYFKYAYFPTAIDDTHPAGYYDYTTDPYNTQAHTAPTIVISDYTWIGATAWDAYQYSQGFDYFSYFGWYPSSFNFAGELHQDGDVSTTGTVTSGSGATVTYNRTLLKSGSARKIAIVFYDKYMRECGVVLSNAGLLTIPQRDEYLGTSAGSNYYYGIKWTLDNLSQPQVEIPDWAYYYSIVSTKDLTRTWFIQAYLSEFKYAVASAPIQDPTTGILSTGGYTFTNTYADGNAGVAFNLLNLQSYGYGYQFNEGDMVYVELGTPRTLSIREQWGNYIICENIDMGAGGSGMPIEIYTPRTQSASEFYFEQGAIYPVLNPTTTLRNYSVISGYIQGDIYLLNPYPNSSTYLVEAMSPSKSHWSKWITNAGRIQIIDTVGQHRLLTGIRWSNTIIEGTRTNGLSSFDALDQKLLPFQCGQIQKLQLTSKVANELGVVMLGICEKQVASMYIGEVQLVGSNENSTLAQSPNVIGTVNILKGNYGTLNPESVTEYRGFVFFLDAGNGKYIQYSTNGLFPVSSYKMTRFWKLWSEKYRLTAASTIEGLGSRPYVFSCVDPSHGELLISIPKLSNTPPKGYLPDYPSTIYPFDILDYQDKTIVYKLESGGANPHWQGAYTYCAEGFLTLQNKTYAFKYGRLHLCNQSQLGFNNFFGVQGTSKIMVVANAQPNRPKVYQNVSIEGNLIPTLTYFRSEDPYQQASDLMDFDYKNVEGNLYAPIYRDKLIPTQSGYSANGLLTGEKMRTNALFVQLCFTVTNINLDLRYFNISFDQSRGQTT